MRDKLNYSSARGDIHHRMNGGEACPHPEGEPDHPELSRRAVTGQGNAGGPGLDSGKKTLQPCAAGAPMGQGAKIKGTEFVHASRDVIRVMASIALPIIFLDSCLRLLRCTPSAETLLNFLPGNSGRPLHNLRQALNYPQVEDDVRQVLCSLVSFEREVQASGGDWYLVRILPCIGAGNSVTGAALTLVDITARKDAEAALRDSREIWRLILENDPDSAIFSTDLDRRIISWNSGAGRVLRFSEAEILGESADVIFTPEDRAARVPDTEQATAIREGHATGQRWHARGDGTRFWGTGAMMARHNTDGVVVGLVKVFRDQTESRNIAGELTKSRQEMTALLERQEQARKAAESAAVVRDNFLAALSHELRTPLNPALITAAALEEDQSLPEKVRARLSTIRRSIELETRLIDDLLDVTKINHGKISLHPVNCNLHDLLGKAADIVLGDTLNSGMQLKVELEAKEHWISGEPSRVQQIFWNLLKNAFKFTGRGGRVTVSTRNPSPGRIEVSVADTGIGIAPNSIEKIFRPFDQGDLGDRHRFGGLGLGLAISKALVELHGGQLRVASKGVKQGTTFTVELQSGERLEEAAGAPQPMEPEMPRSLRLLMVEDHEPTLTAMVWLLERDGHRVFPAGSASAALAIAGTQSCDLLISDIGLPGTSGLDLMREIRRLHGWPGIALSGYGMPSDLEDSKAAGFDVHLVKPIKIGSLRRAVHDLLNSRT